jgi:uncharacterized protein
MDDIRSVARSYFDDDLSPSHDWQHVRRVEALAETLLEEYDDAAEAILRPAVLLHDIGRSREDRGVIDDHAAWGATEARHILEDRDVSPDRIDAICHAIRVHRYSSGREPATLEAKLLCDADNLDALGAVGVARCFSYGGEHGSPLHDPDLPPDDDETDAGATQYNHFYKKILDLPERMYTDAGVALARDRQAFVESFLERFDREVAGDV